MTTAPATSKTIGKYKIHGLLGSGTMGRVYKVGIPVLEKIVALKLFSPSKALIKKAGMDWLIEQFIHEAAVIANIRHPNIAQIWSFETHGSEMFYLMEYFCRNLGELIAEGYWSDRTTRLVPIERSCRYAFEILEGLNRLHDAGIIHRDIKPFNLMITDLGSLKIIDFGLSKRRGEKQFISHNKLHIGTPFYSAPEQIKDPEAVDARADLFSVAVVLYRMLTGHLPRQDTLSPSQFNPLMDKAWDRFFKKSLALNPDDRFQNARQMSEALEPLFNEFQNHRDTECRPPFSLSGSSNNRIGQQSQTLRSTPERILAKHAAKNFNLDALNRPETYVKNRFEEKSPGIIYDSTTGLAWQKDGARYPLQLEQAHQYIEKLKDIKIEGFSNWRLPTMDELLSLLHPPENENFCIDRVFSDVQTSLWSSDTRSPKSGWIIDLEMGFAASSDFFDYHFVKGVCQAD